MLRLDNNGRASFAVLALAILLLANFSVVYLFRVQQEGIELAMQANEVRVMDELSSAANRQVEVAAHYIAMRAILNSTQGPHNDTKINQLFSSDFEDFVSGSFPREERGYSIAIGDYKILVLPESKIVEDVVGQGTVATDGGQGNLPGGLDTGIPGGLEKADRVAYYRLAGYVNYSVSNGKTVLLFGKKLDSELQSPFPFISQQLGRFSISGQGSMSSMAKILRYILTTVAQYRVLQGYAGGEYGKPHTGTYDILTPQDVEIAVNLALLLEELRLFRAADQDAVKSFDSAYFLDYAGGVVSPPLRPSVENRTLARILEKYSGSGTLDPADVFVLFTAIDKDDLRMNQMLAQALYAMIDQFALKYLDYLNFLPLEALIDLGLKIVELVANAVEGIIDWVTGNSKEADMVRAFVSDLFGDLGFSATILGPVSVPIHAQSYDVTNGDGTAVEISFPAGIVLVQYAPRPFLPDNKDIWENYYNNIFQNDLKSVHDGVRDLARDIAGKLANELELVGLFDPIPVNGFIEPRDGVGMLEYVNARVQSSMDTALWRIRNDPGFYQDLVAGLWQKEKVMIRGLVDYIESQYDVLAFSPMLVLGARNVIFAWLCNAASTDPDFASLDETGKHDLGVKITGSIDSNQWDFTAYVLVRAYDFARFESLYAKAASLNTPPEQGGLYQRMMEMISGAAGVLSMTGDFVKLFLSGLLRNEAVSDDKVLIPSFTEPFKFFDSENLSDGGRAAVREEKLVADQTPNLLAITRLTRHGAISDGVPPAGQLLVDILDPTSVPASKTSPNVHYTQVDRISDRPFETQWTVTIKGMLRMRVSSARGVYLEQGGYVPVEAELPIPLDIVVNIKTFSGWPLDGVAYANSNTFLEDVWKAILGFVGYVWDVISSTFGWLLDAAKFLIDQLSSLVDFLMSQASKVLELLYKALSWIFDLLQSALKGVTTLLLEVLDLSLSLLPSFDFSLSAFGLVVYIGVNQENACRLIVKAGIGSFHLDTRFCNLEKAGIHPVQQWAKWDIFADIGVGIGPFALGAKVDPLMAMNDHILEASAKWDRSWKLDIVVPEIEKYYSQSLPFSLPPIQTPYGDIEFELGFRVRLVEQYEGIDLSDLLGASIGEAERECGGLPTSWEGFQRFVKTFVETFVDSLLGAIEEQLEKVIDVTFYVEGAFRFADVAGAGVRLSVAVEGRTVMEVFHWIADNIRALLDKMFEGTSNVHIEALGLEVFSHIFIYFGFFLTVGPPGFLTALFPEGWSPELVLDFCIGASVSLLGRLVGLDLGPWEVRFGGVMEAVPCDVAGLIPGQDGMLADLWLFKGILTTA